MLNTSIEEFIEALSFYDDGAEATQIRKDLEDKEVVGWMVDYGNYDGTAALVCRDADGNWFSWEGNHCSCMGFEDQWGLEKDHPDALLKQYFYGDDTWSVELKAKIREMIGS